MWIISQLIIYIDQLNTAHDKSFIELWDFHTYLDSSNINFSPQRVPEFDGGPGAP